MINVTSLEQKLLEYSHNSYEERYGIVVGWCLAKGLHVGQVITILNDQGVINGGTLKAA